MSWGVGPVLSSVMAAAAWACPWRRGPEVDASQWAAAPEWLLADGSCISANLTAGSPVPLLYLPCASRLLWYYCGTSPVPFCGAADGTACSSDGLGRSIAPKRNLLLADGRCCRSSESWQPVAATCSPANLPSAQLLIKSFPHPRASSFSFYSTSCSISSTSDSGRPLFHQLTDFRLISHHNPQALDLCRTDQITQNAFRSHHRRPRRLRLRLDRHHHHRMTRPGSPAPLTCH